jgi:hypothetical protein
MKSMTRQEFIDAYLKRSGMEHYRTEDGFAPPRGERRVAMPCDCGHETCDGWAMVRESDLPAFTAE